LDGQRSLTALVGGLRRAALSKFTELTEAPNLGDFRPYRRQRSNYRMNPTGFAILNDDGEAVMTVRRSSRPMRDA
jgi:hypothetical protein